MSKMNSGFWIPLVLLACACASGPKARQPASGSSQYCIVDVGSLGTKFMVAGVNAGKLERIYPTEETPRTDYRVRIDIGMDVEKSGAISSSNLQTLQTTLGKMSDQCKKVVGENGELHVIATAASRDADETSKRALEKIVADLKGHFQILSKDQEAETGFWAATGNNFNAVTLDYGSRSFQLAELNTDGKIEGVSFNLGHHLMFEKFYKDHDLKEAISLHQQELEKDRSDISHFQADRPLLIMGGSKISSIILEKPLTEIRETLIHSHVILKLADIQRKVADLKSTPQMEIEAKLAQWEQASGILVEERSKYLTGLITLQFILEAEKRSSAEVVESELGDGYVLQLARGLQANH